MFVAIGWVVVLGAVIGSFVGAGGHIAALFQPFELLCIFGAATGAFIVSNPLNLLKAILKALPSCFTNSSYSKKQYIQLIALLYELLQKARMQGMLAMDADISEPKTSPLFSKYPAIAKDHHLLEFIVDYLRMMLEGNLNPSAVEDLMNAELDTHHAELAAQVTAVQTMADGLPAFGIVAAVMGVVHTMGSVGAPPSVLGEMIAEALVGTFLGILLGYGFIGPIASLLGAKAQDASTPLECVKAVLLAYLNGSPPGVAVEFGRKALFSADRPSFAELDEAMRATKDGPEPPPSEAAAESPPDEAAAPAAA